MLRATEEIGEIEKSRVREEAKAEVLAAKKDLRTLSKRMDQQCTREVLREKVSSWNASVYTGHGAYDFNFAVIFQ